MVIMKAKICYSVVCLGVCVTFILSLFLTFAKNEELPLLRSTGLGMLGFGAIVETRNQSTGISYKGVEDFFENVYGFIDDGDGFEIYGIIIKIIYWIFVILSIGVMIVALAAAIMRPKRYWFVLIPTYLNILLGFTIVVIAFIVYIIAGMIYSSHTYTTQYFFLLFPLVITLISVIMLTVGFGIPKKPLND